MFEILVIGKGLIGAAAARHLALQGASVAIMGPDEPADWQAYPGPFGSHYDAGRITRQLDPDPIWAALAARSIGRYRQLERDSRVPFFEPRGCLYIGASSDPFLASLATGAKRAGMTAVALSAAECQQAFPFLQLPEHAHVLREPPPAGIINPRALLGAELFGARRLGVLEIKDTAVAVDSEAAGNHFTVTTLSGRRARARRILIATGAFANAYNLAPRHLALALKTEHVVLVPLPKTRSAELAGMTPVICQLEFGPARDIYLLPPVKYPDGNYYLKLGANTTFDRNLEGLETLRHWYVAGDGQAATGALMDAFRALMPSIATDVWRAERCVVTHTIHRRPYIGSVVPNRLFVAVGGNGRGAKSADAIGEMAALTTLGKGLVTPFSAADFKPAFC